MGFIIWIVIGGIVGWLASLVMRTDGQQGILLNIVVGIVGAFIASMIISKGNINTSNPLDITNILVSLVGAIILLGIVNLIRRGSVR
ncbi:MAG: GlsB/YeaQ/YmgE family stress response membrane protein [Sphingomicrobium sp.]